jgi:hypothetical protein
MLCVQKMYHFEDMMAEKTEHKRTKKINKRIEGEHNIDGADTLI